MLRFFYLYVYFVDELPPDLTMRSFIHFLQKRLVDDEEDIPYLFANLAPSGWNTYEFSGFCHGQKMAYVRFSKELDEEVMKINEISYPPDEELKQVIHMFPLSEAVRYSGIIPTDMERKEEFLTDEEWEKRRVQEKMEREERKKKRIQKSVGSSRAKKQKIHKVKGMKVLSVCSNLMCSFDELFFLISPFNATPPFVTALLKWPLPIEPIQ